MSQFALSYKESLVKAERNKYLKLFITWCDVMTPTYILQELLML